MTEFYENYLDKQIEALEAGGGGGSADLSNYTGAVRLINDTDTDTRIEATGDGNGIVIQSVGEFGFIEVGTPSYTLLSEGISLQATTDDGIVIDGSGVEGFVIIQAKGQGGIVQLDASNAGAQDGQLRFVANRIGFFDKAINPTVQPTGVAVTAAGIHAALVALGLITA